jgi:SAM-dependent methyltransferase
MDNCILIIKTLVVLGIISIITSFIVKKSKNLSNKQSFNSLSNEEFWNQVANTPTVANPDEPIIVRGKLLFKSVAEARLQIDLKCTMPSDYVKKYLTNPLGKAAGGERGTVLDLGCGTGANFDILLDYGWEVIGMDNQLACIEAMRSNRKLNVLLGLRTPALQLHKVDIIYYPFPENVDAVVAVDVLPYILPIHLQTLLQKIFQALKPGRKFIGTLFFHSTNADKAFL